MKKVLFVLAMMIGSLAAHAANYAYLTFVTTDGGKVSVSVESLTIKISGTTLTAGEQSFTLSNLKKMYFSNSDETTGISEEVKVKSEDFASAIYDLQGHEVKKDQMRKGAYIVKSKNGTFKVVVK